MLGCLLLVAACAVPAKQLNSDFWKENNGKFGVVLVGPVKPGLFKTGQQGALDFIVSEVMTQEMRNRIDRLDTGPIRALPEQIAAVLKARGKKVVAVREVPREAIGRNLETSTPLLDYSALARSMNVDVLIVVNATHGFSRAYYGPIPITGPEAVFSAEVLMVDNDKNRVFWSRPTKTARPVGSGWDAPPDYPLLVQAYEEVLRAGAADILSDLK